MLRKFLDHEMFRRVIKVYKEKNLPSENVDDTVRQRKNKSIENSIETINDDDSKEKDKIKKKKFKFELHTDQIMVDSANEFYVWMYSPTTIKQYIIGGLLVIGCIGICLFPLWPTQVRTGIYYLSIVLASLLASLLSLAVIKYIIFAMVWLITMGKIKFWLLPNLTEDVGFIESFIPFYMVNIIKNTEKKKESLLNTTDNEQDNEEKEISISQSNLINDIDEENKRQKLAEEGFEVLSKDELETK
jgi:translocation protein SEC62